MAIYIALKIQSLIIECLINFNLDKGKTIFNPGVSKWWRALHAPGKRGNILRFSSLLGC